MAIALHVLYVKKMNIYPAYISKHNIDKKNIILMIAKQRKVALSWSKKLSVLLREISSKHDGNLCSLNFLHSF